MKSQSAASTRKMLVVAIVITLLVLRVPEFASSLNQFADFMAPAGGYCVGLPTRSGQ